MPKMPDPDDRMDPRACDVPEAFRAEGDTLVLESDEDGGYWLLPKQDAGAFPLTPDELRWLALRAGPQALGTQAGAWVCFYHDGSGASVHADELAARRHAGDTSMAVRFVPFGGEVFR